jgi:hypothetical protein
MEPRLALDEAPLASITSLSSSSSSDNSNASLPDVLPSAESHDETTGSGQVGAAAAATALDKCLLSVANVSDEGRRSSFGVSRSDPSVYDSCVAADQAAAVAAAAAATEAAGSNGDGHREGAGPVGDKSLLTVPPPPPPASASRRRSRATWKMRLQAPGMALQGQILREKSVQLSTLVQTLQATTEEMADETVDSMSSQRLFSLTRNKILDACDDIFEGLLGCLRESLSSRKLARLRQMRGRTDPVTLDISVRFFGLDWAAVDGCVAELAANIDQVCQATVWTSTNGQRNSALQTVTPRLLLAPMSGKRRRRRRGSTYADVLSAATSAVKAINKICDDVMSHGEAVLAGRLNHRRNDVIW